MANKIRAHTIPTEGPKKRKKSEKKEQTEKLLKKLYKIQAILMAQKKYGILVIFQWLDASGKDGVCKSVFGAMNPLGIDFVSWKAPSDEEKSHDYLWRIHHKLPAKGFIQVFNRSYFEDILVPSVLKTHPKDEIKKRYNQINLFEQYMAENNIKVIKCFFSVSEEVQKQRMEERLENKQKMRKHNDNDWQTLELREKYLNVYDDVLSNCNDPEWHFIPADHNREKNYVTAKILYDELMTLDLERPELQTERTLDEYLENVEDIDDIDELKDILVKATKKPAK
jgi:PPK2 family polyphosphate:nucleotide phosphotransferase